MNKVFLVESKGNDYGACLTELVETNEEEAAKYCEHKEVVAEDVPVLSKYFDLVKAEKEVKRSDDRRYYGTVYAADDELD